MEAESMSKKSLKISIEEEVLEKAKKHIPNLSGFVEECLKHYFGYADGIFPIGNINEITDFDLWYETYSTKELVDLKKHLSESDFELLKKLGIEVKDKIYTEQELEYLDMDLIAYYINEEDMDEEEIKESKDLPENVTREEFNELLEKVNNISIKFNF